MFGLLDLIGRIRDPVDNTVDILALLVDIRLQPVIPGVCLNAPGQGKRAILLHEVHDSRLGVLLNALCALDDEAVAVALNLGPIELDGQVKSRRNALNGIQGPTGVRLEDGWRLRCLTGIRVPTEREDTTVRSDLPAS